MTASIAFDPSEGDLDLHLFDPTLEPLDAGQGEGGSEEVTALAVVAGWHVLWVELVDDAGLAGVVYDMSIEVP